MVAQHVVGMLVVLSPPVTQLPMIRVRLAVQALGLQVRATVLITPSVEHRLVVQRAQPLLGLPLPMLSVLHVQLAALEPLRVHVLLVRQSRMLPL